jgi:predicted transposase/invertase (TIGR01784 family)
MSMSDIINAEKQEKSFYSLMNDAMFKLFFAKKENEEELKSFLKATTHLTDADLFVINVLNPILTKEHVQEKDFIVDIRLTDATGNHTHIEMQTRNHDAFIERVVAYNSRQYASQLNRGEDYVKLKRSISLIVTGFQMFDDSNDHLEYVTYRRKNQKIFTNAQEYFILDVTKIPDELINEEHAWGALLAAKNEEELRALMDKYEDINEAGDKLLKLNEEKQAQEIARAREESQWAWKHTLYHTEERARKEGYEEAYEKAESEKLAEKLEIAKELWNMDLSVKQIIKATGLSEVEVLRAQPK